MRRFQHDAVGNYLLACDMLLFLEMLIKC
jgi:hypothetical protein